VRLPIFAALAAWTLCGLLQVPAAWSKEKEQEPPPQVGVATKTLSGARVVDAVLPGTIVDVAAWPRRAGVEGSIAVLVRNDPNDVDAKRSLWRVRAGATMPEKVLDPLPHGLKSMAIYHAAGGEERLLLGEPGKIWRLVEEGSPRIDGVLELPGLDLAAVERASAIEPGRLTVAEVGRLSRWQEGADGRFALQRAIHLPSRARRTASGLELWTPPIQRVEGSGLYAVGPETLGKQRLRVLLADLDQDGPPTETFSRLATPLDVEEARFVMLDGKPTAVALTIGAAQLNVFEKLTLRVLPLRADRTRAGLAPSFSWETASRRWFEPDVYVFDATGDGKQDLLVIQPEGMGGGDLELALLAGKGGGRFEDGTRKSKLEAPNARWRLRGDFDGDGAADLLLLAEGGLRVHRVMTKGRSVVEKEPFLRLATSAEGKRTVSIGVASDQASVDASSAGTWLELADVDHDPRPEVLLAGDKKGRGLVRWVDWQ
jgi:hypothetical protein